MQILAFLAVVPGAALGNILWRQLGVTATSLLTAHGSIGNIILGFIFLQVLAVVLRPKPENKLRWVPHTCSLKWHCEHTC